MDISLTADELAFRDEVRAFFADAWDDKLKSMMPHESCDGADLKAGFDLYHQRLNARGWMAPSWPVEYGGTDWTATQHFIFNSERGRAGAPFVFPLGVVMVGPVIYTYGTDEQKKKFLPRILSSEDWWCQGYSEPGAGSDLASLQSKAVRDGDDYIVNGTKVWTTYGHLADWVFCLLRTDNSGRKQDGITFLLIDMKSPGIEVRPIKTIDGWHHLNEIHFSDVRVPVENRIGEEGRGWTYAKSLLVHERLSIAEVPDSRRKLELLKQDAAQEVSDGHRMIDDPFFAKRLSDIEIDLMALEFTELRVLASIEEGKTPGPESSLLKLQGSEIQQALQELRMDLSGYYGLAIQGGFDTSVLGHDFADLARKEYFRGRASTIYGGTSEVQKNITAKAVLGL